MNILFRPTTPKDVAALPAIERAAGERFRDVPELAWLADGDVICAEHHLDYAKRGLSWLALANDLPVGLSLQKPIRHRCLLSNSRFIGSGREEE